MIPSTLNDLLAILPDSEFIGKTGSARRKFRSVSTDTRTLKKGELFLAIRGENFDGHDYLKKAATQGAQGGIVAADWAWTNRKRRHPLPLIAVPDTLDAYGQIAAAHRREFDIPVIAVAGSVGKTTTKDMLARTLATKYGVLATDKNLNNRIGVPATILKLDAGHDVAVIEIGTNTPGEIEALCRSIEPTHGLITNIGEEHLEFLKSIEGVAQEEGALFRWLKENGGVPFVNLDDPMLREMGRSLPRSVTFGRTKRADFQAKVGRLDERGAPAVEIIDHRSKKSRSISVQMSTPGVHTAMNALAVASVAFTLGVPPTKLRKGLEEYEPEQGDSGGYARLAMIELPDGGRLLNDTYNANPDSMRAALETLAGIRISRRGKRIAVLGDMAELGAHAPEAHREVGRLVPAMKKVDIVMFIGRHMRRAYDEIARADRPAGVTSFYFRSRQKLAEVLGELRSPEDLILVKGSRSMAMETIVQELLQRSAKQSR